MTIRPVATHALGGFEVNKRVPRNRDIRVPPQPPPLDSRRHAGVEPVRLESAYAGARRAPGRNNPEGVLKHADVSVARIVGSAVRRANFWDGQFSRESEHEMEGGEDLDEDDRSHYSDSENHGTAEVQRSPEWWRRQTVYSDDEEDTRYSRYTASVYSVTSVLDDQKSGEARERFVRRVQALYGQESREEIVPPVPKLPEGLWRPGVGRGVGRN